MIHFLTPKNLARLLIRCFNLASGLKVNFHKSTLFGVSTTVRELEVVSGLLHCKKGNALFIHLGVPICENMNKIKSCGPVVDKYKSKLSKWNANNLTILWVAYLYTIYQF